jgi:hypothetical protein
MLAELTCARIRPVRGLGDLQRGSTPRVIDPGVPLLTPASDSGLDDGHGVALVDATYDSEDEAADIAIRFAQDQPYAIYYDSGSRQVDRPNRRVGL